MYGLKIELAFWQLGERGLAKKGATSKSCTTATRVAATTAHETDPPWLFELTLQVFRPKFGCVGEVSSWE